MTQARDIGNIGDGILNVPSSLSITTAGTERFKIDSSGRITSPSKPMFCVRANQTGASTNYSFALFTQWSNTPAINVGNHWNGTRFTAPVAGNYFFGGVTASFDQLTYRFDLYKNGSIIAIVTEQQNVESWDNRGWSLIVNLNANDYVQLYLGGRVNTDWTWFYGKLIG